jgi:hypothetical protein
MGMAEGVASVASPVLIGTHPRSIPYPIPCRRDCRPSPLIPLSSSHPRHRILIAQFLEFFGAMCGKLCISTILCGVWRVSGGLYDILSSPAAFCT